MKLYLDTNVVVKRYVTEKGSDLTREIYQMADAKEIEICFSVWNVGEAIGVIDQYLRRGWITEDQSAEAIGGLAGETIRLMKIEALQLLPLSASGLSETWHLIRKHHIYQGDALQLVTCTQSRADKLVSADKALLEVGKGEGITSVNIEGFVDLSEMLSL